MTVTRAADTIEAQIDDVVARLAPVDLRTLVDDVEPLTRVDRKYVVPIGQLTALIAEIAGRTRVLEIDGRRDAGYRSVYLDTADLRCFRAAGQGRPRRFTVRTRRHLESGDCYLEVESVGPCGTTVKARAPHPDAGLSRLSDRGLELAQEALACSGIDHVDLRQLIPTLEVGYRRRTLWLTGRAGRPSSRATIDLGMCWHDLLQDNAAVRWPEFAIVATMSVSTPSPLDRALWGRGFRPTQLSEYGTGLACLRPYLSGEDRSFETRAASHSAK